MEFANSGFAALRSTLAATAPITLTLAALLGLGCSRAPETVSMAKNATPAQLSTVDVGAQKSLPTIANARGLNPSFSPYLAAHRELTSNSVVPRAAVYLRSAEDR